MGERGPQPGERGRLPTPIDIEIVRRTAAIGCTMDEVAAVLGVPRRTLYDRMEQDPEIQRALDEGRAEGRVTLRRRQWKEAQAGNPTMLIWLGKQLLGQRDKRDVTADETISIVGMHLAAARAISNELTANLEQRTLVGRAEPVADHSSRRPAICSTRLCQRSDRAVFPVSRNRAPVVAFTIAASLMIDRT